MDNTKQVVLSIGLEIYGAVRQTMFMPLARMGTIRKYNGTSWGSMTSGTSLTLQGIWGSSGTNINIFAVGGAKDNQSGDAIILKSSNGTSWTTNLTYTVTPQVQRFHDVWGASDSSVYVVGELGTILHTTNGGIDWTCNAVPSG